MKYDAIAFTLTSVAAICCVFAGEYNTGMILGALSYIIIQKGDK